MRGVWWLSPAGAASLTVPASLLLAWRLDDAYFRRSWGTPKALTEGVLTLFLAGALLFALGAMLPLLASRVRGRHAPADAPLDRDLLRSASVVLFRLTMIGYLAMAVAGIVRGARLTDLWGVLTSAEPVGSPLLAQFAPVAGVTTLTQLGIAYVVVSLTLLIRSPDSYLSRRLLVVFMLGLLRAFFLSERLAILELAIPACGILALTAARRTDVARRWVGAAPFLLIPGAVGVFAVFEYSRSWSFYSSHSSASFLEFAIDRLAGYYATAYNNGQLVLLYGTGGERLPYTSIEAFWTAPGVSQLDLYRRFTGMRLPEYYAVILSQHGNPELNSPGGLAVPFVDYGTVGGLVFFLLVGVTLGVAYRRWLEGALWASLTYPVALTGLFELPRYLYWGQGRVAPAFAALFVIAWLARRRHARIGVQRP